MRQMYCCVNCFDVITNLRIVAECKKEIMVAGDTSKNHQIENGVKWCKMDLKWEKTLMFNLANCEMPHNCCFWLYALIIDKENLLLY